MQRIALITGGGSGIGRAVALAMHAAGYGVAIAGRRPEQLDETRAMAAASGAGASGAGASGAARPSGALHAIPTDVGDPASVKAAFEQVQRLFGRIDVLFNNAGTSAPAIPMEELAFEQWQRVVATNLTGAFLCAQQAMRLMKTQQPRGGRIINNGSIAAHVPRPDSAPYTATKHAISGLTKSIALDGRRWDIACSQIDIGNAETERTERMAAGIVQADGSMRSEPRIELRHVTDAVLYMAGLPLQANVLFMTVMATQMPLVGRG